MTATAENLARFNVNAPFKNGAAVTKSDTTTYDGARGLYVGVGGNIAIVFADDPTETPVTFTVPAGWGIAAFVKKVMSTNTTASGIVILY